ncbi:gibberellin 3-beta-dioxygenase 1-like [Cornus florida]|uniref:gibberellin 3-beta-dioxygenase 1-like n=1 Tax=Cornus florida TaxID=4283 RepID=UPI0028A1B19E|nr:gibberellin 3-beta-dioxygenase 1-like [Cornus florida]
MPSRNSDASKTNPVQLHQNFLDLNSVTKLPDSHAWTSADYEYHPGDSCSSEMLPVIDLNDPNAPQLVCEACKTWGAFQVANHGITTQLFNDIESAASSLFSLPKEQKLKVARAPDSFSGYGMPRIASHFSKLMWYEGFTIIGSPLEHARQLWPQDYNKFCDVIEEYKKEMKQLTGRLIWLMLGPLGITKEDIEWAGKGGESALQLNSYPVCPDPDHAMGLAEHTDSTLFTILHQNNTSGLQVLQEETGWVTVPPLPSTLVVNIGDLLHILSNGLYHSVLHRAMVNRNQHRFSVAYLSGPPAGTLISPLSKLVDKSHPPLYRPVSWSEYLSAKKEHFNNTLSTIRLYSPQ